LLELIIKQLIEENPIDAKRLYVTGQSGGGGGTLTLITRRPKVYAAAVPVCPGNQITPQTLAQKIAHMPLWFFHGAIDQVIPAGKSRDRVAALKKAGSKVRYTEYPRMKHNAWDKAYAEPAMVKWLFEQKLESLDD